MSRAARILMIVEKYKPSIGGVEKHLEKVAVHLSNRGLVTTILTSSPPRNALKSRRDNGIRIVELPQTMNCNPFLAYLWVIKNRQLFASHDIVHIHDIAPFFRWYFPLALIYRRIPIYATFHGYERDPVPIRFKVLRKIARRLVRGSICIGHFIPNVYGIACDVVLTGAADCVDLTEQPRNGAVFVGRLEQDTGLLGYIEAIAILKEMHGIEIPLTLCGKGSLRRKASDLAISRGIAMEQMGLVPNPQAVMNSNQLCLAAGYLSILEAMSLGLPVIGIARSSLKAAYLKGVLKDGGPISIQTTPEGVAREIARIINDPHLASRISKRGKQFASKMSWDRMTRAYLDLWTGVSQSSEV